jgi:hypothetical protein
MIAKLLYFSQLKQPVLLELPQSLQDENPLAGIARNMERAQNNAPETITNWRFVSHLGEGDIRREIPQYQLSYRDERRRQPEEERLAR